MNNLYLADFMLSTYSGLPMTMTNELLSTFIVNLSIIHFIISTTKVLA